ncbi:MAG TPA: hypothetical protein VHE55_06090 [Fimbriimonadaceae bacterium]|nr:hypothetical protein [Fimbriimonadaceae bacterium]
MDTSEKRQQMSAVRAVSAAIDLVKETGSTIAGFDPLAVALGSAAYMGVITSRDTGHQQRRRDLERDGRGE